MFHQFHFMGGHHRPWGFGPGRAPEGAFEKGALKLVILDLLKDKPAHGYELIKALEEKSHGMYTPSAGSVYPILQLLTDMGFLTASESDGKKTYAITETGRKHLDENREMLDHIHEMAHHHWHFEGKAHLKETFGELHELGGLFRSRARDLSEDQWARVSEVVKKAAADIRKIIGEKA
jgi:DNA-binding PadR family transcriptional regulator